MQSVFTMSAATKEQLRKQMASIQAMLALTSAMPEVEDEDNMEDEEPEDLSPPPQPQPQPKDKVNTYFVSYVLKPKFFQDNKKTSEADMATLTKHINKIFSCTISKTSWGENKYKDFVGPIYGAQFQMAKQRHNNQMRSMSKVTLTTKLAKILKDRTGEYFSIPEFCKMDVNTSYHGLDDTEADDFDYSTLAKSLCTKSAYKKK